MLQLIAQANFGQGITNNSSLFSESSGEGLNAYSNLESLISSMIGLLTVLGGIFFVFFFVLGAFQWITAGGDSSKVEKARNQMIQGVLGLVVMVAAYAIIGLIGTVVGLDLLRPGAALQRLQPASSTSSTTSTQNQASPFEECMNRTNGDRNACAGLATQ
jgi:hypothetical protein